MGLFEVLIFLEALGYLGSIFFFLQSELLLTLFSQFD